MTETSDASDAVQIQEAIGAALPPTARPWTVIVEREHGSGPWHVDITHEASAGVSFGLGKMTVDETIAAVLEFLPYSSHELEIVATAPPLTNPEWVSELRTLSSIFNWTKAEVRAVVRMVERDHLQPEEAEWLISAIGRDDPPPECSTTF